MKMTKIKPNPNNPRKINPESLQRLKDSVEQFPKMMKLRPIVIDHDGMILGGNMRYLALKEMGWKEIPDEWVKIADELTPDEKRRFIIADNVSGGEWDYEDLAANWDPIELENWGLELPENIFEQPEAIEDGYEIPDEIETDIQLGDLFEIGEHRLLCGDSTDSDQVAKLMNGEKAILMVTDPPYGVEYDPNWRATSSLKAKIKGTGKVMNDDRCSWKDAYSLFTGNVAYVWHSGKTPVFANDLIECGFKIISQIIWNKNTGAISRGDIHWKHEPCYYAVRKGKNHNWQGARNVYTVWDIRNKSSQSQKEIEGDWTHGTSKPIECMARPIEYNTKQGEGVYDPFIGSGSTMVAAHQLNRKCYGMELDTKYCQVIIDRMIKLDPEITIKRNGVPYDHNSRQLQQQPDADTSTPEITS
jgi:DNA modification methylase